MLATSFTPYLTVAELKRSPIYTQLRQLIPEASAADNEAELARIIMRVTAMINGECRQNLAATVDTESGWCTYSDFGELRIHCRNSLIIEVQSLSIGSGPLSLTPLTDLSGLVLDPWRITVPAASLVGLGGFWGYGGRRVWVERTYVNGYPVTTLAAPAVAGATTVTVANATGIMPGDTPLAVQDGRYFEMITPSAVVGNVLTIAPLQYAHQVGVGVSCLPNDVEEAALLLISRVHDSWSLNMGAITRDGSGAHKPEGGPARALCDAAVMLAPYRRVW